ncbi:MAG: NAD-dependent epimerase/dehydratase family protein [Deltaproteobacteria bacterium]|nr:NAD-dependent epimerase/dehydratase family protein [Deltaproteobacteria bacterium]
MAYRILVTGGVGFIGSHTVDALVREGNRVRIVDNLSKRVHPHGTPEHLNPKAELMLGDVREKGIWEKALNGVDVVYHFAAYQDYLTDFSTFFHVNAVSTALLYEVLVETGLSAKIKKVIVAASQAVMGEGRHRCPACHPHGGLDLYPSIRLESQLSRGDWEHRCPVCRGVLQWMPSDESVVHPCNPYALSKHSQEQIALNMGKRYGIPSVVMRYSIVQGERQSFYNAYSGAMRIFALSLFFDQRPVIFEDGKQVRDFINIHDVTAANLKVLENDAADGRVFNVGGGIPWTILDFYQTMQKTVGKALPPRIPGCYRFGDTRHIVSDITRLRSLGWSPQRTVKDSIEAYWSYITGKAVQKEALERAQAQMAQMQVIRKVNPQCFIKNMAKNA